MIYVVFFNVDTAEQRILGFITKKAMANNAQERGKDRVFLKSKMFLCNTMSKERRFVLDRDKAREIYQLKVLANRSTLNSNAMGQQISSSVLLAQRYGVTSKTIRDIWNRKIWTQATADLNDQDQANPAESLVNIILDSQVCIHLYVNTKKLRSTLFSSHSCQSD